jgi:hypothetical protein
MQPFQQASSKALEGKAGLPIQLGGAGACGTPLLAALWPLVEEPTEAEPERVSSSAPSLPVDDVDSRDLD